MSIILENKQIEPIAPPDCDGQDGLSDFWWTPELVEQLSALWEQGVSAAVIGRKMGISKDAVIGKVHRLNLPRHELSRTLSPEAAPMKGCRFPMWPDDAAPTLEFCGKPVPVAGAPYCHDHMRVCFAAAKPRVR
jgi:GcrA cell cycle regulator